MADYDPNAAVYDDVFGLRQQHEADRLRTEQEAIDAARAGGKDYYIKPDDGILSALGSAFSPVQHTLPLPQGDPNVGPPAAPPGPPAAPPGPPQPKLPPPSQGTSLREHADDLAPGGKAIARPTGDVIRDGLAPLIQGVQGVPGMGAPVAAMEALPATTALQSAAAPQAPTSHIRYQLPGGEWKEYSAGGGQRGPMPDIAPFRDDAVFGHARSAPSGAPVAPEDFRPQDKALPSNYNPGPAVSYPGGGPSEADYLRYRAHDPLDLLALQNEAQAAHTTLERGRVGGPMAEQTAGEKLAASQDYQKRTAPMMELARARDQRLQVNDARRIQLETWKAGLAKGPDGRPMPPLSDSDYKRYDADLQADKEQAQKEYLEGLAYTHAGSASGFDHFAR